MGAIDVALCVSMVALFVRKLSAVLLLNQENGDLSASYNGAGSEWLDYGAQQHSRQSIMVQTMTKHALLATMAMAARLCVDVLIVADEVDDRGQIWNVDVLDLTRTVLSVMASMVQCLCVYLSFHFSQGCFNGCCSCCHRRCQMCVEKCTENKFQK